MERIFYIPKGHVKKVKGITLWEGDSRYTAHMDFIDALPAGLIAVMDVVHRSQYDYFECNINIFNTAEKTVNDHWYPHRQEEGIRRVSFGNTGVFHGCYSRGYLRISNELVVNSDVVSASYVGYHNYLPKNTNIVMLHAGLDLLKEASDHFEHHFADKIKPKEKVY